MKGTNGTNLQPVKTEHCVECKVAKIIDKWILAFVQDRTTLRYLKMLELSSNFTE